jgi:hypothetical protein
MRSPPDLHYYTVFDVRPSDGSPDPWKTLVKTIQAWMRNRSDFGDQLELSWFYTRGRRQQPANESQFVETNFEVGNGTLERPEFWAARMQTRDTWIRDRYWRTDIGITALPGNEFTIIATVTHFLQPDYAGAVEPSFSVPEIVVQLQADYWMPRFRVDNLNNGPNRRVDLGRNDPVSTIEDVQNRHRRNRIGQLRDVSTQGADSELVELLEAENRYLEERVYELQRERRVF